MKKIVIYISKRSIIFRKIVRFAWKKYKGIYYFLFRLCKVDENLIVFEAYMGRSYAGSPKALYEYLKKQPEFSDFKFVWAFKKPEDKNLFFNDPKTKLVKYRSLEYLKTYAKAKYWFSNSRIPEYITKRKNQVYVQTWHGTPLKRLGYDINVDGGNALNSKEDIRKKYDEDAKRYDYLLSPSKFCTKVFTSAFNLKKLHDKNIIIEEGYPRNDFLFNFNDKDVKIIKEKLNIDSKKKILLYAPTWRDNQHTSGLGYTYELGLDFDKLKQNIGDEYIVLFRAHYFIANKFDFEKYKGFVYDVSSYDDINDLYIISDLLITDYSSVFFDFANLNKPIIFYMYDFEEYKNKLREFYFDLKILPGPIVEKENILFKEIKQLDNYWPKYKGKYQNFNKKFNYLDGKNSSKKVIEKIFRS